MTRTLWIVLVVGACLVGLVIGGTGSAYWPALPRFKPSSPSPTLVAAVQPARVTNVYAAATAPSLARAVAGFPARVYVPNSQDNSVDVIDPVARSVITHFSVGAAPQHITPAWDLSKLYVDNTSANTLTVIDPSTGLPAQTLRIADPYNLYFTPDGSAAVVVAERLSRLDFYDRYTWTPQIQIPIAWPGVDHLDFSADGSYLVASAEFSGMVVKVDLAQRAAIGFVQVGGLPVDVRLSPDGSVFYVANQSRDGVSVIDAQRMQEVAFIPTGRGAHGLTVSRDATLLYVSNRLAGTISVIDFHARTVVATWSVGGNPDMMQISFDGRELWVSNRFGHTVSVIDTSTGRVLDRIAVGESPHGLTYFPQPGAMSIGHNGVYR